jgi:hypothetical protein
MCKVREELSAMKILCLILAIGMLGFAVCSVALLLRLREVRRRAEAMAFVEILDGTHKVEAPNPSDSWTITDNVFFFSDSPRVVVTEWSAGGFVGEPVSATAAQWKCNPGYQLKFDGGIPYCERHAR